MKPCSYMLAPMEDVTDTAMRTLCYEQGADVTFTEMARFESLARKNKSTVEKTALKNSTPSWIQIVGSNEQLLERYLRDFEPVKGFLGFNLNLGCPSQNLISNGIGSAMIRRISKTQKLLAVIKEHGYSSSIKMRLGLTAFDKEKKVYLNLISAVDTDMIIVHGRIASDGYDTPADHRVLEECCATGKTIIANGDIDTVEKVKMVLEYGARGVMIGRSAICNPGIFATLKGREALSISELKEKYALLAHTYLTPEKYKKNVLTYMGRLKSVGDQNWNNQQ